MRYVSGFSGAASRLIHPLRSARTNLMILQGRWGDGRWGGAQGGRLPGTLRCQARIARPGGAERMLNGAACSQEQFQPCNLALASRPPLASRHMTKTISSLPPA